MNKVIKIVVDGGVVQSVDGIPDEVEVHVWDYDVEGRDITQLNKDADGILYSLTEW